MLTFEEEKKFSFVSLSLFAKPDDDGWPLPWEQEEQQKVRQMMYSSHYSHPQHSHNLFSPSAAAAAAPGLYAMARCVR